MHVHLGDGGWVGVGSDDGLRPCVSGVILTYVDTVNAARGS